jgi:hypothetical protein
MTEKPGWINDRPVTMEIDGLRSFASYLQQELDTNVRPNVKKILDKLGPADGDPAQLSFGADGLYYQGRLIGNFHTDAIKGSQTLLLDLQKGLQAVAWAAQNIANDFQGADELNSMDLARVDGYFNPKDGGRTLGANGLPDLPPADQT